MYVFLVHIFLKEWRKKIDVNFFLAIKRLKKVFHDFFTRPVVFITLCSDSYFLDKTIYDEIRKQV